MKISLSEVLASLRASFRPPTRLGADGPEAFEHGEARSRMPGLREVDGALVDNWYIACLSEELGREKPLARTVYEYPIALWRDREGRVQAVLDRCLHRATRLSEGRCEGDHLRCPYHGWSFDGAGRVREIPSEGPQALPLETCERRGLKLRSFPVVEQDGAVWVWTGEPARATAAPPWRFPYAADARWSQYFMITDFENEVTHLVENFMDVPHTVFVHDKWFRSRTLKKIPITVEVGGGRVKVTYDQPQDQIGFTGRILNPRNEPMLHTDEFIFPNITRVDYSFGDRGFVINSQCTPVGRYRSRVYTWIAFNLGPVVTPAAKPFMQYYTRQVIEQDVEIMRNQGRNLQRFDERGEGAAFKSTAADELHLAIERLRDLGARGESSWREIAWTRDREIHV
ncbi:MAG TPA: aromatic ring-hydroxylating dioxygenase subunit alpha [Pseudobdellovibrionaceae bacterium]|nr:aromatic ring-hydroxylating dioxygenase subunit alpha [Pseudobdellovibrionaceae bacterium]